MEVGEVFEAVQSAEKAVELCSTWSTARRTLGRAQLGIGEVHMVSELQHHRYIILYYYGISTVLSYTHFSVYIAPMVWVSFVPRLLEILRRQFIWIHQTKRCGRRTYTGPGVWQRRRR